MPCLCCGWILVGVLYVKIQDLDGYDSMHVFEGLSTYDMHNIELQKYNSSA